mmetsp:Transcript_147858/g.258452  ORF Transcript_147858/g.258452 Transcript_147858/m.258452 type:complete len:84 (+) Transcript_147858:224-475(+)
MDTSTCPVPLDGHLPRPPVLVSTQKRTRLQDIVTSGPTHTNGPVPQAARLLPHDVLILILFVPLPSLSPSPHPCLCLCLCLPY